MSEPISLYRTGNHKLYAADFLCALRDVGVASGTLGYIHTDLTRFGRLDTTRDILLHSLAGVLKDSVGNAGTLLFPSFCFGFYQGKVYDPDNTPGCTGILNEFFRTSPSAVRTSHPTFSSVVWGRRQSGLAHLDNDAFGQHSIFGLLHREGGKIVCFGVPFHACATFVHYAEQCYGVPYRTMKVFTGKVLADGREQWATCSHYAKPQDGSIVADYRELENRLRSSGDMKAVAIGNSEITCVSADAVYRTAWRMLDDDVYSVVERREI